MKIKPFIHTGQVSKLLLFANILLALIYFSWWFFPDHIGNPYLYGLLFFGEIYHIVIAGMFWATVWPRKQRSILHPHNPQFLPLIDIFIPVAGEPIEIIKRTAQAAKNIRYGNHKVFILNDGFVSGKDNWQDIEELSQKIGVTCITRRTPGGAKAGNINHALSVTSGEIVVIFDADMVSNPEFIEKVLPYFQDNRVGFVQTPQYYQNSHLNSIAGGAWEQQEFFFGPVMRGKDTTNSAFICGTNVAIRRQALIEVGGLYEKSIAEDFLTSLFIHKKKWKSHYVSEVLVVGLAPEDLLAYYKQQLRWARGSLEVLFGSNPLFMKGLTLWQKLQYLSSALYYFNGLVILIDIVMPLVFLYTGLQPVAATTTSFALYFIPFMFLNLYTLFIVSKGQLSFRAISFSQASFMLQLVALRSVLLRQKMSFSVTPKQKQQGLFLFLVYPHLFYILLTLLGTVIAVNREGINPSVTTNIAWCLLNIALFIPFIAAAYPWKQIFKKKHTTQRLSYE